MNELLYKEFQIKATSDTEDGLEISGYGAVFGNIDSYKDVIQPGAFASTLTSRAGRIAFCYQHDIWNPIGRITEIKEDEVGLFIRVVLSKSEDDISTKIKEGILKEMSIGYRVIESSKGVKDGIEVQFLNEIELFEISLVTIAANPLAVIQSMKSEEKKDYLMKEFDRLISIVKNEKINYEIRKLKSLTYDFAQKSNLSESHIDKNELLNILINGN